MDMNISAVRGHTQALKFAELGGTELSEMLSGIATAKESERRGPVHIFAFLAEHFTDDDGVHSIPVPGSKKGETGNLPYDKYTTEAKTADGTKKIPGSWYTDVVKNVAEGVAILQRLEYIDQGGGEGIPEDIVAMRTGEKATEKKRLKTRLTDMRTALVKGSMLFIHADEISKLNVDRVKVKMPFRVRADTGKMEVYGNLIRLQDPAGEEEDEVLTTSEFLRLDLAKLDRSKPVTITSLMATKARPPKSDKNKGKGKNDIVVPTTVEGLLNLFNIGGTAIDTETEQGAKLSAALMAACATPGSKGDDIVENIGDFALSIDAIWTVIDKRYNQIKADKARKLNIKSA